MARNSPALQTGSAGSGELAAGKALFDQHNEKHNDEQSDEHNDEHKDEHEEIIMGGENLDENYDKHE